ncbi:MAG: hypothetical protein K9W45_09175 [Candidatus Heimdallarchaeum aukensis]|uniref:Uncharacterized protein n=1 Tax=Candidatus Heimdallarchaeum aukensis TaxID=2876573 RepID=A0A9Y1BJR8_9ARCH|nr:MAG: hypothetical protein K9W45_09175 [Candidatus Heimdallarchaeum aukensis]
MRHRFNSSPNHFFPPFLPFLRSEEVSSYFKSFLYICGFDKSVFGFGSSRAKVDPRQFAESFQTSWIKLHFHLDKMRFPFTLSSTRVLSLYHPGRYVSSVNPSNGFDDLIVFSSSSSIPSSLSSSPSSLSSFSSPVSPCFTICVIEQKMNHLDVKRLDSPSSSSDFTRYLSYLAKTHLNPFILLLQAFHYPEKDRLKLSSLLYDRSLTYSNSVGLDFLRKITNGDFLSSLKLIEPSLDDQTINNILRGSIIQHQLISLIKSGFCFKLAFVDGYYTVKKRYPGDLVSSVICYYNCLNGSCVEIHFPSSLFEIRIDSRGHFLVPQYSESQISSYAKTENELMAYQELNNLFNTLRSDMIFNVNILSLPPFEIVKKVNLYQKKILFFLLNSRRIADLSIFNDGFVKSYLEIFTLPKTAHRIKRYLSYIHDSLSIFPYSFYQQWNAPFGDRLKNMFSGSFSRDTLLCKRFKEKLLEFILSSDYDFSEMPLEFIETKLRHSPDIQIFLDCYFSQFALYPDGNFLRFKHNKISLKALAFWDETNNQWFSLNKKRFYILLNFEDILANISKEVSFKVTKNLLLFPIKFSLNKRTGQLSALFNTDFTNTEVNRIWVAYLKKLKGMDLSFEILSSFSYGQRNKRSGIDLFYNCNQKKLSILLAILSETIKLWSLVKELVLNVVYKKLDSEMDKIILSTKGDKIVLNGKQYKMVLLNYNESNSRVRWSFKHYLFPVEGTIIDDFVKKCYSIYTDLFS